MSAIEFILGVLTSVLIIGTIVILFYRNRMTDPEKMHRNSNYSKKRILKLVIYNIAIHIIAFIQLFSLYLVVVTRAREFSIEYFILSIILFLLIGLIFYGGGVYITSMVLEAYTIPELTKSEFFKTQLLAIKMFHHPISHILELSGGMFALLTITFLDITIGPTKTNHLELLVIAGMVSGIVWAYSQIKNGTAIFQVPASLICLAMLVLNYQIRGISITYSTLGLYIISFLLTFNLTLVSYVLTLKKRRKKIFKPLQDIHPIHIEAS